MEHLGNGKIIEYMMTCIEEYRDPETDEINMTRLAEDACQHFDAYEDDNIPERFFEIALIAERRRNAIKYHILGSGLSSLISSKDSSWF